MLLLSLLLLTLCSAAQPGSIKQENTHEKLMKNEVISHRQFEDELIPVLEKKAEFWQNIGHQELRNSLLKQNLNKNKAKNIIFFLGDGMSLSTVVAARILQGQRNGKTGEEGRLSFEKFPHVGLSKTYCTNSQVADSACSATAFLCGVKANMFTIGVTANVHYGNCTESMDPQNQVSSIAAWAQKANKSTGFITTTTLTHATPSGTYAHVANRMHESDTDVASFGADPAACMDIATQLVTQEPGRNFNILMGGGASKFLPNNTYDAHGNLGIRQDGKNLLSDWQTLHPDGAIVSNRKDMLNLDLTKVSNIMGVFQSKYMDYHLKADPLKQPTLSEMTETAIKLMQRNPNGYFLFIEGGLIDTAHHETKAAISLDETLEFAKAIQRARDMTNESDTLIVITADHAHPLTISGYPGRGNDILGLNQHTFDVNGEKYLTLNYAMSPKRYLDANDNKRMNMENLQRDADFEYPGYVHNKDSRHSGDDVGIYASGPFAHLFTGVMEENTIPYIMAYAACLGDNNPTMCDEPEFQTNAKQTLFAVDFNCYLILVLHCMFLLWL